MPKSVHSQPYDRFREMLVSSRKAAGLTQSDVARSLQRPQSYVSKYENGERRLDLIEFLEVADVLALDIDAFIHTLREHLKQFKL